MIFPPALFEIISEEIRMAPHLARDPGYECYIAFEVSPTRRDVGAIWTPAPRSPLDAGGEAIRNGVMFGQAARSLAARKEMHT